MSQLLPPGIAHLGDAPFTLHSAILTALRILGYEEWDLEERPPKRIWLDGDQLTDWWNEVKRKREEKYGGSSSRDDDLPDDDPRVEHNAVELITRG